MKENGSGTTSDTCATARNGCRSSEPTIGRTAKGYCSGIATDWSASGGGCSSVLIDFPPNRASTRRRRASKKNCENMKIYIIKRPRLRGERHIRFKIHHCGCRVCPSHGKKYWRKSGFSLRVFDYIIIGDRSRPKWCNAPF